MLLPHIPTPLASVTVIPMPRRPSPARARPKSIHQPLPAPIQTWFRRDWFSERSVCVPSMSGRGSSGSPVGDWMGAVLVLAMFYVASTFRPSSNLGELGVGIAHPRQVGRARTGAELVEQIVASLVGMQTRDPRLRIVQI